MPVLLCTLLVAPALVLLLDPAGARAEEARPFLTAATLGVRGFESALDLEDEAAGGGRIGLGLGERFMVLMDAVHSTPARKTTGRLAYVTGLRALARFRPLSGNWSPYALAGLGGLLFNFSDANDTAAGALTMGAGLELRVGAGVGLFAEGSADFYRASRVTYSSTGQEISSGERTTDRATTFSAGASFEF